MKFEARPRTVRRACKSDAKFAHQRRGKKPEMRKVDDNIVLKILIVRCQVTVFCVRKQIERTCYTAFVVNKFMNLFISGLLSEIEKRAICDQEAGRFVFE